MTPNYWINWTPLIVWVINTIARKETAPRIVNLMYSTGHLWGDTPWCRHRNKVASYNPLVLYIHALFLGREVYHDLKNKNHVWWFQLLHTSTNNFLRNWRKTIMWHICGKISAPWWFRKSYFSSASNMSIDMATRNHQKWSL